MSDLRTILQCPKCNAMLAFEYPASNIKECTCGAVLVKKDNQLTVAEGLNNVTVKGYQLKPGTTGQWEGRQFRILGKMGVWFEESFFSYWCIVFKDGATGFLAEGYGLYSILLEDKQAVIKDSDLGSNKVGQVVINTDYQFQKKSSTFYWEVEGELCLKNFSTYFDVYEYDGESGKLFTLFKWGDKTTETFSNNPTSFDDLKLENIQEKNPYGIQLKCPQCAKEIVISTYPLAQSCTCNDCGTFYSIEKKRLIDKGKNNKNTFTSLLPLGANGIIKNINYRVVGYTKKQEQNAYKAKWREYVLFNPTYGFAFLSEFNGHWIYVKETLAAPVILNENTKTFEFDNESFHLYNSYSYTVIEARGEFPYNAFDNKNTMVKEYISPPEIWIREKDSKEGISWFWGQHIAPKEIKKAFAIDNAMPYRIGVGAVQPTGYINIKKLVLMSALGILGLLLVFMISSGNKQNKILAQNTYYFPDSADKIKIVTEKFVLNKWRSNVQFDISSPVSNSWFELSATLVNVETGKEYTMEQGIEYYYGYTDGENWTEGSHDETAYITNVPAGKYFLEMEGARETNSAVKLNSFSAKVIYDVAAYRNLWFAIFLLLLWPVINYIRNQYTEKSRWQDSPYSNYTDN
ncbi:DUF4178 domain-containing protein [Ferruginibacter profundus]